MTLYTKFITTINETFLEFVLEDSFILSISLILPEGKNNLEDLIPFETYDLTHIKNIEPVEDILFANNRGEQYVIECKKVNDIIKIINNSTHLKRIDKKTFLFFEREKVNFCIIYEKFKTRKPLITILRKKDI